MESSTFNFQALPIEIQVYTMSFLPKNELVTNVSMVCKDFFEISRDNSLWEEEPIVLAHKHIKVMFPEIKESINHFEQAKNDNNYLKSIDSFVRYKMSDHAQQGNLISLKALCIHGFIPDPSIFNAAVNYKHEEIIKFFMLNYKNELKIKLESLKNSDYKTGNREFQSCFITAEKFMNGEELPKVSEYKPTWLNSQTTDGIAMIGITGVAVQDIHIKL